MVGIENYLKSYEGEFQDSLFEGYGKLKEGFGCSYEGEWRAGKKNGHGTSKSAGTTIIGEWKDDKACGHCS